MRVLNTLFILFSLLLLLSFSALAQENEATEEAVVAGETAEDGILIVPDGVETADAVEQQLETVARNLFSLLWSAAYIPFAAPLVTVLTALSKRLPFNISSPVYVFFWTVVLWAIYLGATHIGYANQFESIVTGLATLGATLLGLTLTPVAAGGIYQYANKHNVAVVGKANTQQPPRYDLSTPEGKLMALNDLIQSLQKAPDSADSDSQKVSITETAPA